MGVKLWEVMLVSGEEWWFLLPLTGMRNESLVYNARGDGRDQEPSAEETCACRGICMS